MFLLVHFSYELFFSKLVSIKTKNHSYTGNRVPTIEVGGGEEGEVVFIYGGHSAHSGRLQI